MLKRYIKYTYIPLRWFIRQQKRRNGCFKSYWQKVRVRKRWGFSEKAICALRAGLNGKHCSKNQTRVGEYVVLANSFRLWTLFSRRDLGNCNFFILTINLQLNKNFYQIPQGHLLVILSKILMAYFLKFLSPNGICQSCVTCL